MEFTIQVCSYLVGLPLEILAISAILRSGFRRYPLVFVYVLTVFLTTVVEMRTALTFTAIISGYYHADATLKRAMDDEMNFTYWRDEGILQVIIFATVISLIYSATSKLAARRIVRLVLLAGAMLFVGISFLLNYNPDPHVRIGIWMTPWTMSLKFCSAILDLALWALLIRAEEKNRVLLAVSGGLGIMFAGGAIGQAIRSLATDYRWHGASIAGGLVMIVADMMLLFILWQIFRKAPQPEVAVAGGIKKSRP